MSTAYAELTDAMRLYFDGFHTGDTAMLKKVFHPCCHLISAATGDLVDDDMDAVYARVAGRAAPATTGQVRYDHILSIDLSGPETALVKCQIAIEPKLFTDYLNFARVDGQWRIVSKVFTFVMVADAARAHPAATAAAAAE